MWDCFLSEPQTQSEHDIRQKLGEELHQLEVYQDRGRAGHPVSRILWARGLCPFVWPDDTPGTMPGEIPLFIVGIESEPIRVSIIPVPTVGKREGHPLTVAWVGPRLPSVTVTALLENTYGGISPFSLGYGWDNFMER